MSKVCAEHRRRRMCDDTRSQQRKFSNSIPRLDGGTRSHTFYGVGNNIIIEL